MSTTVSQGLQSLKRRIAAWITDLEYRLRASWPFALGSGARRVFFPGCALPAADPKLTLKTYEWLKARDPSVELWSDCCGQPLEKFSTDAAAARGRERMRRLLTATRTAEIITACGNCAVQFNGLDLPGLRVTSVYRLLAQLLPEEDGGSRASAPTSVVHHPCSARIDKAQQADFHALAQRLSLKLSNAEDKAHPLPCCLVKSPSALARRAALSQQPVITYCAHCTVTFQADLPTRHVLQEVFGSAGDRWKARGKLGRFLQYFRFARLARRRGSASPPKAPD
jgi:Fe-S oxidoreductase